MKNGRGKSIHERMIEDIEYAKSVKDAESRALLATKALGAADLAVEFGLITYTQWEQYINDVFNIM